MALCGQFADTVQLSEDPNEHECKGYTSGRPTGKRLARNERMFWVPVCTAACSIVRALRDSKHTDRVLEPW